MESKFLKKPSHKEWRRLVKKKRRQLLRQKAARERDKEAERVQQILEKREDYVEWQQELKALEEEKEKLAQKEHEKLEEAWLEAEEKAQKEWSILQEKKAKAREVQLAQEEKIRQEFEEMQENARKKKEAERRRRDEQKRMFEKMKKEFDAYIDDGAKTPRQLRNMNETQPGKEICPFFNKTGACRYGDICSRNHQRPSLSKVILVPNFYTHFSLERHSHEYDTDVRLEYDARETRNHFRDFYFDVVPELEKFGKIRTLQYCRNTEPHLRGNLYVEYMTEREAAGALRGLKGRWYAGRQLHCEFVDLKSWRGAICGMMRCPKGSSCNFLHTFRNPTEDYGVKSPPLWQKRQEMFEQREGSSRKSHYSSRRSNWEDEDRRNWRWSESPEREERRPNQYRNNNNRFQHRNQFDNRRNFDNRRGGGGGGDRFFNRNQRNFNDRNRFDNRRGGPPRRQFDDRRFKRRYSGSDDEENGGKYMRKRSPKFRSQSRSISRSRSRSHSSRSISRSRSRSPMSRSLSRSRTRSRSPIPDAMIDMDEYRKGKSREVQSFPRDSRSPSPSLEKRGGRPPSPRRPKETVRKPTQTSSKWDSEKREDSDIHSRGSRSRSRSRSPYRGNDRKNNAPPKELMREQKRERDREQQRDPERDYHREPPKEKIREPPREMVRESKHHREPSSRKIDYSQPPPPGTTRGGEKDYEWDTTDSDN